MIKMQPVPPLRAGFWSLILGVVFIVVPFKHVVIDGNSMYPTLKNGASYLVDRLYWRQTGLQRDDIVVFRQGKDELVKRLVGMPADILQLEYVPGTRTNIIRAVRNLTVSPSLRQPSADNIKEIIVPIGGLYVLGDNYYNSDDSRRFGPVPMGNIFGVVRTFDMRRTFPRPAAKAAQKPK
jgi:signal peptidase I